MSFEGYKRLLNFSLLRMICYWVAKLATFSQPKLKPIVSCSLACPRALRRLHAFDSISYWFIVLFDTGMIGQGDYFGYNFMTCT